MSEENKTQQEGDSGKEETLLEFLQRCPIDEETWEYILDRPNDPPRDVSFDDWQFDDETQTVIEAEGHNS